jgi:hypothetical protein
VYPFSNAVLHSEFYKLNLQYPDFDRLSLVDGGSFDVCMCVYVLMYVCSMYVCMYILCILFRTLCYTVNLIS